MTKPDFPKKFSFRPDGHGRAQNDPKIGFFRLFSKSAHLFFLIFCTKLEGIVGYKMAQAVFSRKFLFFHNGGIYGPKNAFLTISLEWFDRFC